MIPSAFAPILSHLWQSTLFAGVAGLLTLALRRNSARVRYAVWLAASYKFLIPFSWLVSIGHFFEWRSAAPVLPQAVATVTSVVGAPVFLMPSASTGATPEHSSLLPAAIWCIWACGFVVLTSGWAREWWRIRCMVKRGKRLDLGLAIPVVSVPSQLEPGVFGIIRPMLLLPERIGERLEPEQMRAVVAHELVHVRQRDNLAAAIHMLVEALFWFHPLVWWVSGRMIDERERACDEAVLQMGGEPAAYVETILAVCKSYVAAPTACMSGISGADLKKRIARIMSLGLTEKLTLARKAMLLAVGIAAVAGPLVFGVMNAPVLGGQQSDWEKAAGGKMKFDVASVKEDKAPPSADTVHFNVPIVTADFPTGAPTGGLYSATNLPVAVYLGFAYKLQGHALDDFERQLQSTGPGIGGKRYDIEARATGNPTRDQYRLMMQSLFADRFKVAVHWEKKEMPVIALVLDKPGKLGHQLRPHLDVPPCTDSSEVVLPQIVPAAADGFPLDCGAVVHDRKNVAPGNTRYFARNVSMAALATTLSYTSTSRDAGKPVVDQTGLIGEYDFIFEFTPDSPSQAQPDAISLTSALKDDLGLKLEPATAPVDMLILDHIEEPSPN